MKYLKNMLLRMQYMSRKSDRELLEFILREKIPLLKRNIIDILESKTI